MTTDTNKVETMIILKYGSMKAAFVQWLHSPLDKFTADEQEALVAYSKIQYPNLNLIRTVSEVDK